MRHQQTSGCSFQSHDSFTRFSNCAYTISRLIKHHDNNNFNSIFTRWNVINWTERGSVQEGKKGLRFTHVIRHYYFLSLVVLRSATVPWHDDSGRGTPTRGYIRGALTLTLTLTLSSSPSFSRLCIHAGISFRREGRQILNHSKVPRELCLLHFRRNCCAWSRQRRRQTVYCRPCYSNAQKTNTS